MDAVAVGAAVVVMTGDADGSIVVLEEQIGPSCHDCFSRSDKYLLRSTHNSGGHSSNCNSSRSSGSKSIYSSVCSSGMALVVSAASEAQVDVAALALSSVAVVTSGISGSFVVSDAPIAVIATMPYGQ
ncbi:hypothetical protein ElyMa_000822800 [Elysia marginata]|uniref:Uncharacterized protein n=1 Tax=Elysia marginata TaxID=1093978 RepID=A0AAV4GYW5_9GAST|nr:hypothetical protein ElyMa_000822800 [Elysia marginata]